MTTKKKTESLRHPLYTCAATSRPARYNGSPLRRNRKSPLHVLSIGDEQVETRLQLPGVRAGGCLPQRHRRARHRDHLSVWRKYFLSHRQWGFARASFPRLGEIVVATMWNVLPVKWSEKEKQYVSREVVEHEDGGGVFRVKNLYDFPLTISCVE